MISRADKSGNWYTKRIQIVQFSEFVSLFVNKHNRRKRERQTKINLERKSSKIIDKIENLSLSLNEQHHHFRLGKIFMFDSTNPKTQIRNKVVWA